MLLPYSESLCLLPQYYQENQSTSYRTKNPRYRSEYYQQVHPWKNSILPDITPDVQEILQGFTYLFHTKQYKKLVGAKVVREFEKRLQPRAGGSHVALPPFPFNQQSNSPYKTISGNMSTPNNTWTEPGTKTPANLLLVRPFILRTARRTYYTTIWGFRIWIPVMIYLRGETLIRRVN